MNVAVSYQVLQGVPFLLLVLLIAGVLIAGAIDMVPLRIFGRRRPARAPRRLAADERRARLACAPSRPHVESWPSEPPVRERVVDVINRGGR